jgi:hypothetical protein
VPGDFVTMHTARTNSWGVSDGVDVTDGYTAVFEVYEVDAVNNRLVFRTPVMTDYPQQAPYTSLGGQAASGSAFAFITKGLHVQPAYIFGARGGLRFAMRKPVQIYNPPAVDDFESTVRVTKAPASGNALRANRVKCWDAQKPHDHNVAGNGKRDGSKMVGIWQWVISSQAAERFLQ